MTRFVKLRLHDGREVAYPVGDIEEVCEPEPEEASAASRSGCTLVGLRSNVFSGEDDDPTTVWVIGTVDHVLAAIRDAQREAT